MHPKGYLKRPWCHTLIDRNGVSPQWQMRAEAKVPEVRKDFVGDRLSIADEADEEQILANVNTALNGLRTASSPSMKRCGRRPRSRR